MRYYSTQRPVGPGTYPRQGGTETVTNFNGKIFCEEIGREAWGYIEYREPITPEQAKAYELTPGGTEGRVLEGAYSDSGRPVAFVVEGFTIDYGKLLAELEREKAACQYAYGEMVPAFYAQALCEAIEDIRECRDCAAEAAQMVRRLNGDEK